MNNWNQFEETWSEYQDPRMEFEGPGVTGGPAGQAAPPGCIDPQFPPPPNLPRRKLTPAKVSGCVPADQMHRTLQGVVKRAVDMLDKAIKELSDAREAACRGQKPKLKPVTACWLKYKLSVCIDDPSVWTAPSRSKDARKKTVAEVIRRLMRPRDLLSTNQIRYKCMEIGDKETHDGQVFTCKPLRAAWVLVRDVKTKVCLPGTPEQLIRLCPLFWTPKRARYQAQTIIHEAVHLTHCAGGIEDKRIAVTIGSPTCVAQFVAAVNGEALNPNAAFPCGRVNTCGAIPANLPQRCGASLGPPSR